MNCYLTNFCTLAGGLLLAIPLALHAAPPTPGPEAGIEGSPPIMGNHGPFDAGHLPRHLQELKLTDEQRKKIGEILKTQGPVNRDKFLAGMKIHHELRKLSLSSDFTEDKARALSEDGAKIMAEAALMHARMDHEIFQLLTAEQQQQWRTNMETFRARHGRGKWHGEGFRPPKPD